MQELNVRSGELVALRLFDVAYAINLVTAEQLWTRQNGEAGSRTRLTMTPAKALDFDIAPLRLQLPPVSLTLDSNSTNPVTLSARVTARLYDFGVIALALRVTVADCSWEVFSARFNALDRNVGHAATASIWGEILAGVCKTIAAALERPATSMIQEDYLLGIVHTLSEPFSADELKERIDLVALLSGESRKLSPASARDLLSRSYSYFADDLVVLTWDRAFIYEPRGDSDVADVIEVANAQLVEFRYYDELLDDELPNMYDRVEATRRTTSLFVSQRLAELARKLYTLVAEVTELTEKVDNTLQVTEDIYLARVYSAALDLFRVPKLSAAVDKKLAIIRDTYSALYDEASSRRNELLEIAIVLLIVLEIVLALIRG